MPHQAMPYTNHFAAVMKAMTSRGLLLAAYDKAGRANAMAIGWGAVGSIWGLPLWTVLVRPSRYTYECIEHSRAFSVNVPGPDLAEACALCGSKSGRDGDKLAEAGLKVESALCFATPGGAPTIDAKVPILPQCPIIYTCSVVHLNDVLPATMADQVRQCYPKGDYHRLYFGKITSAAATEDAARRLA